MSWSYGNKKWSVSFKSLNGTDCRVDIYKRGYTGDTVTTLTGAAKPFEYEEGNDEDLLNNVIRYRTGYLRVIENNYGDLADLYPELNTDRYIEFYYNNVLDFNGFIQAQEFETPWEPGPREVELPVISPLGLASDTTIDYTLYNPPRWMSVETLINEMLAALEGSYEGYYFPKLVDIVYPLTLPLYVNSLTFCPFGDKYDKKTDSLEGMYDPKTVEDALINVCTWMGLILHDVPGYVVFQRLDFNGEYFRRYDPNNHSYNPSNTDLSQIALIASNDNVESRVMPMSKIEVHFAGETDIPYMNFSRCHGYAKGCGVEDHEFCTNSPMINDFEGTYTIDASIDNNGELTSGAICLGAYGSGSLQEMLMFCPTSNWELGKKIATYNFYEWNGRFVKFFFNFKYGASMDELNNPDRQPIAVIIKCGSYYFNDEERKWLPISELGRNYTYLWGGGQDYCEVDLSVGNVNLTTEPLTVEFYATSDSDDYVYTVSNVGLKLRSSATEQYLDRNIYDVDYTIEGAPSLVDGTVERGYSTRCYTLNYMRANRAVINTGYLENDIINAEPSYPYLLQAQDRLQIDVKMPRQDNTTIYLNRLTLWGTNNKWRVIAYGFKPWDDTYKLTLHHSSVFDT